MPMFTTLRIGGAGVPAPLTRTHPLGEVGHLAQHRVHLRHDVLAVDHDLASSGARNAVCSTARSSVTLILSPRNIASMRSRNPARCANSSEEPQRLVGDAVLRVVEVEALGLDGQALAPLGVGGEEVAQVGVAHLLEVLFERVPLRGIGDRHLSRSRRFAPGRSGPGSLRRRIPARVGRSPLGVRARTPPGGGARPR